MEPLVLRGLVLIQLQGVQMCKAGLDLAIDDQRREISLAGCTMLYVSPGRNGAFRWMVPSFLAQYKLHEDPLFSSVVIWVRSTRLQLFSCQDHEGWVSAQPCTRLAGTCSLLEDFPVPQIFCFDRIDARGGSTTIETTF